MKKGFTLLELLIVVAVLLVMMGLLVPAFFKVRDNAREKQAQIEANIIGQAIAAYKLQTKRFPAKSEHLEGGQDRTFGASGDDGDNNQVMDWLLGANPPVLDKNKIRLDDQNNALNPWDRQYRISLDLNYNGQVEVVTSVPEDDDDEEEDVDNEWTDDQGKTWKRREYVVEWNFR